MAPTDSDPEDGLDAACRAMEEKVEEEVLEVLARHLAAREGCERGAASAVEFLRARPEVLAALRTYYPALAEAFDAVAARTVVVG
jgi:lipopolysaccharide biosynthesis regulator YciM